MLIKPALVLSGLVMISPAFAVSDPVYSESFTGGSAYCTGNPQVDNWVQFLADLPSGADSITISGSLDPTGFTCNDPDKVATILNNLKNDVVSTVDCGSTVWSIGHCGNCGSPIELSVGTSIPSICSCPSSGVATLRPAIGNNNWGGINGDTCGASSQTLSLSLNGAVSTPSSDFGDAPAPFPTLLADGGARHTLGGPSLGTGPDAESNGQPDAAALGDDNNGDNDEDGVTLPNEFETENTVTISVEVTNGPALLNAWIDLNADGDWDDAAEWIISNRSVNSGTNAIRFDLPEIEDDASSYARFRVSTDALSGPGGAASDGEVEDYQVTLDDFNESAFLNPDAYLPKSNGAALPVYGIFGLLLMTLLRRRIGA